MAEGLQIEIVSPENQVLSAVVHSVTVPGTEGYFTVMANHAPFMSTLRPGFITVTGQDQTASIFYVGGGFADVSPEGLTILAETASSFADFSAADLQERIQAARAELERAATPEDRTIAQQLVSAMENLAIEAGHLGGTHIH